MDKGEHAITVTRKLGFRYLWIDRYCINQQRIEEVSTQVQQMDLVYQNSEVTTTGKDSQYGLPGVGRCNRSPQARAKIGNHFLVSALKDPQYLIRNLNG